MGKTEWARCLGDHFYCCHYFNLDDVDTSKRYAVFDDMRLDERSYWNWKAWLGGQKQFTVTDKYRKKFTLKWGKPVIWLCNPASDLRDLNIGVAEQEWLRESCVFVDVVNTLF